MHLTKTRLAFVSMILMLIGGSCLAQSEVYRWVDENGVVNFSEQPPADGNAETIDTRVANSQGIEASPETVPGNTVDTNATGEPISAAEKSREERASAQSEAAEKKAVTDRNCASSKALIAQLEPMPRVLTRNEEGEVVRMDDNDRLENLKKAQDYVNANCDN